MVQVVKNLENALASADPAVEKLFLAAFTDVVLDHRYLHGDEDLQQVGQAHYEHFMRQLP